jgi:predicted Ser/Thr protein kinase
VSDYLLAGRYRLTDRIAAGGMGEVWRAEDSLLNRAVAVKLLPTGRAGDEAFLARFRAEARYAASLSHSGIARVYDYGESAEFGGAYLVMELVNGEPLSAILARAERLSPDATLDIISQSARALDVAHQAGIVHRDIKPGNLLVAAGGTTKITDFGIATAVAAAQASHLTETGMVMGTAMYVSPEQATGAKVTDASDVYSLGVVAYECLAGRPPFTASEPLAIAFAHKHEPVPPLPPDVPPPVSELVYHMLAKTPEERPASMRAVADRADMLRGTLALSETAAMAGYPGTTRSDLPAALTGPGRTGPPAPARGGRFHRGPVRRRDRDRVLPDQPQVQPEHGGRAQQHSAAHQHGAGHADPIGQQRVPDADPEPHPGPGDAVRDHLSDRQPEAEEDPEPDEVGHGLAVGEPVRLDQQLTEPVGQHVGLADDIPVVLNYSDAVVEKLEKRRVVWHSARYDSAPSTRRPLRARRRGGPRRHGRGVPGA